MKTSRILTIVVAAAIAVASVGALATQVGRLAAASEPGPAGGLPATTPERGMPERVMIPAIGVDAALVPVGLKSDGSVQTPAFGLAAWYRPGPRPGDRGPAVLLAHVDSRSGGPDVFHRLGELRPGDRVTVRYHDVDTTFAVTATQQTAKSALPTDRIWRATKKPVLRLITCGGRFDRTTRTYTDNIIVYADRLV